MAQYAENTKVSVAASKAEIEQTLNRFGIHDVMHGTIDDVASVMFKRNGRPYRMSVRLPDPAAEEFKFRRNGPHGRVARTLEQRHDAWEQACRVKFRELALLVKAKLVAIQGSDGDISFENEFLAYQMLPRGGTVGEWAETQLQEIEKRGEMPSLMPPSGGGR